MSAAEGDRRRGVRRSGAVGVAGEVEAGEEGLEGRVAVDEGSEEVGPILDDGAEGEDEEGEEEEGEEVRGEGGGGLSEELRRAAEVVQPGMVIAHRAFSGRKKTFFLRVCFGGGTCDLFGLCERDERGEWRGCVLHWRGMVLWRVNSTVLGNLKIYYGRIGLSFFNLSDRDGDNSTQSQSQRFVLCRIK